MAIAYVGEKASSGAQVASPVSISPSSTLTAGNLAVLMFTAVTTAVVFGINDSVGNTWFIAESSNTNAKLYFVYSLLTHDITPSDHVSIVFTSGNCRAYLLEEFSGIAASPLDSTPSTTTTGSSPSLNMTAAGDLSIATGDTVSVTSSKTSTQGWDGALVAFKGTNSNEELVIVAYGVNSTGQTFTKDPNFSYFTTQTIGSTRELMAQYNIYKVVQSPATINGSSSLGGDIIRAKPIAPASIAGTSSMGGAVTALHSVAATINGASQLRGQTIGSNLKSSTTSITGTSSLSRSGGITEKDWPQAGADPGDPGSYGTNWRAKHRPGVDGLTKDGQIGPQAGDESGKAYLDRITAATPFPALVGTQTYDTLGTDLNPAVVTIDMVNGVHSNNGDLLFSVLGDDYYYRDGTTGKWVLRNLDICGSLVIDGATQEVRGDYALSATPQTITVSANATKSPFGNYTGAGFPGIAVNGAGPIGGKYYALVGTVLCTFDYATSTTLVNVATADGNPHLVFAGQYTTYMDSTGTKAFHGAILRNVRVRPPVAYGFQPVQSPLASGFGIGVPAFAQITTGNTIAKGTSPATVTVTSTTAFTNVGQKILIGNDIVSYTGKTATTFTGCTWPVGGATANWVGGGTAAGYYVFEVENYNISVEDNTSFPSSGVVEIDGQVEIHYQGKSGTHLLTGCATASRWAKVADTYPRGMDVRTCLGAAFVESEDGGNGYGCIGVYGAWLDARDCGQVYAGKGPGALRFEGSVGTTIDRHYSEFNWYDVGHIFEGSAQNRITNSVFVTHCGAGNTGAPHVDGFQGWNCTQLDNTAFVENCAFLGNLTNAHEFFSSAQATNSGASNWPPAQGMYYKNSLLASSRAGSSNGKGGLIDESINCGAINCWYDGALFSFITGPFPETSVTTFAPGGSTKIYVGSLTAFGTAAPSTTTLVSDVTITRDTSYAQILSTLSLASAAMFLNNNEGYIVLSDGTKACALRFDYKATNDLKNIRWLNGTAGTYLSSNTTVFCMRTSGTTPVDKMAQIATDAEQRIQVVAYTGTGTDGGGSFLSGVLALEYDAQVNAIITPSDPSHLPPVNMLKGGNQYFDGATWQALPNIQKLVVGSINATSALGLNDAGFAFPHHVIPDTGIVGTSSLSGSVPTKHPLPVASIGATSSMSGTVKKLARVAGTIAGTSSLTSTKDIHKLHNVTASIAGLSSLSASLPVARKVAGSISGVSTLQGFLSKTGRPDIFGSIHGVSSLSGGLQRKVRIPINQPCIYGHGTLSGRITHKPFVGRGSILATSSLSMGRVNLVHTKHLAGSIQANSSLSMGRIDKIHDGKLFGDIHGLSTLQGGVIVQKHTSSNIYGRSHLTGSTPKIFGLPAGSITGQSTLGADLIRPRRWKYQRKHGTARFTSAMSGGVNTDDF